MITVEGIENLFAISDDVGSMELRSISGLEIMSENIVKKTKDRIQNNGQATNGSSLITKSSKTHGAYSYGYGKKRESNGLQTLIKDLTYSGKTMASFTVISSSDVDSEIGFDDSEAALIASYAEDYADTPIFDISENDINAELDKYENYVLV